MAIFWQIVLKCGGYTIRLEFGKACTIGLHDADKFNFVGCTMIMRASMVMARISLLIMMNA